MSDNPYIAYIPAAAPALPPALLDDGGHPSSVGPGASAPTAAPSAAPSPAVPQPVPLNSDNPYTSYVHDYLDQAASRAQLSVYAGRNSDPDTAAQAMQLAPVVNALPDAIEQNLPAYQQRARLLQTQAVLKANPVLAQWIAANPPVAKLASDDFQNLGAIGQATRSWSEGWSEGIQSNALARLYYQGNAADPHQVADLENTLRQDQADPASSGIVHFLATNVSGLLDMLNQAAPVGASGAAFGAGLGVLGNLPGAAAGAAAGFGVGTAAGLAQDAFKTSYGNLSHALSQVQGVDGQPIDPTARFGMSLLGGLAMAALQTVGLGRAGSAMADGAASLVRDGLLNAVTREGVPRALGQVAVNLGKEGLTGGALGTAMGVVNVAATEAAKQLSPGTFQTVLNDPATRAQAVSSIGDSAAQMALLVGGLHGIAALPDAIRLPIEMRQATSDASALDGIMQTAADSALRARAPGAFADLMSRQFDGSPIENVFVPGDAVRELYQRAGVQPGEGDGVLGFVPDIRDQLEQSAATGGDVVIPTSDYVTHLAGTDIGAALQDHVRVRPDGVSPAEMRAFSDDYAGMLQAHGDAMEAQQAQAQARAPAEQQIGEDVRRQAMQAGFSADTATQYADLAAARYMARGERLGEDPLELYRGEGINIVRDVPPRLQQASGDQLDALMAALRGKRKEPTDRDMFGPSLAEFLANRGGVEDPGGDLAAMGAGDWHKGRPGVRRLIRATTRDDAGAALPGTGSAGPAATNEFTPDAATRAAWEAGYLPGADRPDINALHDALGRELHGQPVYSEQNRVAGTAPEFQAATRELDEVLNRLGIDPRKATTAEVRQALHQYSQGVEGGGRTFGQADQPAAPVSRISGEEIAPHDADLPTLRKAAREFYEQNLRGTSVHSDALGKDVEFRSGKKAFNTSANPDKLRLFASLRDVIQRGDLESSAPPRVQATEPTTRGYHFLTAQAEIGGRPVRVGVTVREDANGHLYYNHSPLEEAAPPLNPEDTARKAGPGDEAAGPSTEGGSPDLQPAGPRRKGGPGTEGGGTTYDQTMGMPDDGVNMHVLSHDQPDGSTTLGARDPGVRGRIQLGDGKSVITLFEKANLSTTLHEFGHQWLDELTRDAARPDAPQQMRDDLDTVMKHLGVDRPEDIGTEQHEQFARSAEAYLMEGKAPSAALAGAFRRFKAWLTAIYRRVTALGAPISPELRGVFDRLLATDDEIADAQRRQGLDALFRDAQSAGMTDAEFRAYQGAIDAARGEAEASVLHKVMGDLRRQRTAEWKAEEAPIREDVTEAIDARPEMQAMQLFRNGRPRGSDAEPQRIRLNRQALVDMYGSDAVLDAVPKAVPAIHAADGLHPDLVAEMVGLRGGDDLVQRLMGMADQQRQLKAQGDGRGVRTALIDQETHARMVERHGEALTDGSLETEAADAIHNERQAEVLSAELRALGRTTKKTPTPFNLAREWAQRTVANTRVSDLRPQLYARAEAKAGRAAMRAVLAGDHEGAFQQKQAQLLNHALAMEARSARDAIDAGQALMQRFGRRAEFKTIDAGYVDRIHDLLRRFDQPLRRDPAELERGLGNDSLEKWATDRVTDGRELFIAPDLYNQALRGPADELTVQQHRDLTDTIRSIAHVGRAERTVTVDGEKAERADVVRQMLETVEGRRTRQPADFANQGGATGVAGAAEKAGQMARNVHAMLLKPEAIIDVLDDRDPNGIFNKAIWRPIKAAQGMEADLQVEVAGRIKALQAALGHDYGRDFDRSLPDQPELVDPNTGRPMALKKRGVIGLALNVGNESNLDRLTKGYGWSPEGVQAVLDRNMTVDDWRYVQGIWDTFESLFPRIEAMQRRMTGVGLEKIEPREVQTPHGPVRGGYYPVVYDPNLSLLGDRIKAAGDQRFEADYVRATTPKGHTVARVDADVREPLSLNPDVIHWKLGQAIHDLAYREAIVQADKLLRNRSVMGAVDETVGREQRKQLDTWLQGIANERNIDTRGLAGMDAFLHRLRTNATVVGIGFRGTTMLKHGTTALFNSVGELGPSWMARGSAEYFGSIDKMRRNDEMIFGKSAEMRHRMNDVDRDVRESLRDTMGKSGIIPTVARFSHYGVAKLDMLSAMPTWLGGYRKALADGMGETDAVAFADKTVRNAHGANNAPDLAAIQRGSEAQKLFTMFYGFFNHIYNRQVAGVQAAQRGIGNVVQGNFTEARGDFAKTLSTFFFYLAVPALIEGMVAEGGPNSDKDEGWLGWGAKQIAGEVPAGIPLLRDLAKAAFSGRSYEMSPVAKVFETALTTGKDIAGAVGLTENDASPKWTRHAVETAGYMLGLPTGQAAGTAQFLKDVATGDQNPQGTADWLRGLVYGPPPKSSAAR